jgi:2-polyprenyl-3-methyl-5-hydroxy-6-metoxy-1,4-benzoquinol methylase
MTTPPKPELEHVECPTCGNQGEEPIYQKDGWNIVRCLSCRLAMVNPRRKGCTEIYKDDDYFSHEDYYYDYEGNKAAYQKGFRSKLKLISRHCNRKKKLLDIGAAYGFFMEEAASYGFEPFGVELSAKAAEHARRHGVVYQKPFTELNIEDRFSVISFIDSLEHFEQPIAGLQKAHELLEDQGIVAVMVPNIDSLFARLTKTKWHLLLPEEHLFYFNQKSIQLMLEKSGFDMVYLGTGGYGRSMDEILRVLLRGKGISLFGVDRLLRKITLEVNLGDIFAIARKAG